jgi:hypothetical protein
MKDVYLQIIEKAVDEVNQSLSEGQSVIKKDPNTVLMGAGSDLDSLMLVNILLTSERLVSEILGKEISVIDENSLDSEDTPFATLASLAKHLSILVQGS